MTLIKPTFLLPLSRRSECPSFVILSRRRRISTGATLSPFASLRVTDGGAISPLYTFPLWHSHRYDRKVRFINLFIFPTPYSPFPTPQIVILSEAKNLKPNDYLADGVYSNW